MMLKLRRQIKLFSALNNKKGFSIVELLVAVSIMVAVTLVTFIKYPSFKDSLSLKITAQEIASGVRQAQVYGLGVREFGNGVYPGYGANFNLTSPSSFVVFADLPVTDNLYDPNTERVETINIQSGNTIYQLCGKREGFVEDCGLTELNILYLRPYPTIVIKSGVIDDYEIARIKTVSPRGTEGPIIRIEKKSGLISIE